jgi:hypothetical protein
MNAPISTAVLDQVQPAPGTVAALVDHFLLRLFSLAPPLQQEQTVASILVIMRIPSVVMAGPLTTTLAAVSDRS